MAKRGPLLSPALKAYVAQRYLADTPPRELATELREKFGVSLSSAVLRQWCTRNGLGKRKKELDAKTCAIVSSAAISKLATAKAADPRKHLERWADRSISITDKAFDLAEASIKPRDFSSAVGAMSTAIKTFRICSGIDKPGDPRVTWNFNLADYRPTKICDVELSGSVEVSHTPGQPVNPATRLTMPSDPAAGKPRS